MVRKVDKTVSPTAVSFTVDADPAKNDWNLGAGSDVPPGGFAVLTDQGYGAEVKWSASGLGLQSGHIYRLLFMVHDGGMSCVPTVVQSYPCTWLLATGVPPRIL